MKKIFLFAFLLTFCAGQISYASGSSEKAQKGSYLKSKKAKIGSLFDEEDLNNSVLSTYTVKGDRLENRPVFNMGLALPGTIPGLQVSMSSGLISSSPTYSLRGYTPLILVDGVPRSDIDIPISQVESISVIKDAVGLSRLGMMAGSGVVSIVTKSGGDHKLKFNFKSQLASNSPIYRPKFLNSAEYAKLLNEAYVNTGESPLYSQNDIEKYISGTSPYSHPDVNWDNVLFNKNSFTQIHNLNFSGGTNIANYFVDLNIHDQNGFVKEDRTINQYRTQDRYTKYSIRTKVDVRVTDNTFFSANLFGQMKKENTPGGGVLGLYNAVATMPNNALPVVNPDSTLSASWNRIGENPYGMSIHEGSRIYSASDLNLDLTLRHNFSNALEGLYIQGLFSYNSMYRSTETRSKKEATFEYLGQDEKGQDKYIKRRNSVARKNTWGYDFQNRSIRIGLDLGYSFKFDDIHYFDTKISAFNDSYIYNSNLPFVNTGAFTTIKYNYDNRYIAEIGASYMSVNQLSPKTRRGFFPSVGLGWNISNEEWFSDSEIVNSLRLVTSYGRNGYNESPSVLNSTKGSPSYGYNYIQVYPYKGNNHPVRFGVNSDLVGIYYHGSLVNNYKYITVDNFNLSLYGTLLDNRLSFSTEFFNIKRSGMPGTPGTNKSAVLGIGTFSQNLQTISTTGADLGLSYSDKRGDFAWNVGVNTSFYKSRTLYFDEGYKPEEYMKTTGKYNREFGYVSEGIFQTEDEIANSARVSDYKPKVGDLKYKDLNNDGVIDGKDVTIIGKKNPNIYVGINGGAAYKSFGFSMQWSGILNRELMFNSDMPFTGGGSSAKFTQARVEHLTRWTPGAVSATMPRLTVDGNAYNRRNSTFWLRDASYMRLKHIEFYYNLPVELVNRVYIDNAKLFVTGYNLLTISSLKDRDPELLNFSIPNIKAVTVGLNIQF